MGKHQHICSLNQRGILKMFLCWTLGAAEDVPGMALSTILHVPTWHIPSSYQWQFCHFYAFRLLITQIIYKAITASLLWNTAFYSSFSIQKWNSAKNPSKEPRYIGGCGTRNGRSKRLSQHLMPECLCSSAAWDGKYRKQITAQSVPGAEEHSLSTIYSCPQKTKPNTKEKKKKLNAI